MIPTIGTTTRQRFDAQLNALRSDLLSMGFETEEMLRDAVAALTEEPGHGEQVEQIADGIVRRDDHVDAVEAQVESACVHILSMQQPVLATDLRLILTVLKAANDVERIGDHAVNIAKTVRRMHADGIFYRPIVDIGKLGEMARRMLHDSLEAMVHHDAKLAQSVIDADDAVDELYARMRRDLQAAMESDPTVIRLCSSLMFVIHYLERVSDRATNVAEQYLYLDTGRAMRFPHHAPRIMDADVTGNWSSLVK
jgi:phosphate transport system protein